MLIENVQMMPTKHRKNTTPWPKDTARVSKRTQVLAEETYH